MVLNFRAIEIVLFFHNIQEVKFLRIRFCIVCLHHMMIVQVEVL